jgi:murein DD-endopeptidase MepM/ murein hydrolase activator NlpD
VKKFHHGVDIPVKVGTAVHATGAGKVIRAGWENDKNHNQGFGRRITIDHGNGRTSVVAHLSEVRVKVGDKVTKGQQIGKSGNTGASTGPHVHYQERVKGKSREPTFDPEH